MQIVGGGIIYASDTENINTRKLVSDTYNRKKGGKCLKLFYGGASDTSVRKILCFCCCPYGFRGCSCSQSNIVWYKPFPFLVFLDTWMVHPSCYGHVVAPSIFDFMLTCTYQISFFPALAILLGHVQNCFIGELLMCCNVKLLLQFVWV